MRIGTKSILFGVHQFLLHPLFVMVAWWKLYQCPSWRELLAIVIHDWGYWGVQKMESPEGDAHPEWAAVWCLKRGWLSEAAECLKHSRFFCKDFSQVKTPHLLNSVFGAGRLDPTPSRLCWADKLGTAMYPVWLWVMLAKLSGECREYMDNAKYEIHAGLAHGDRKDTPYSFFQRYKNKVREWRASGWAEAVLKDKTSC